MRTTLLFLTKENAEASLEVSFEYSCDRQFYVVRFHASVFDSVPFVPELRFWGVTRNPCQGLSALAAIIAMRNHPLKSLKLRDTRLNAPVCTALTEFAGFELHPEQYDPSGRELLGGNRRLAPRRFRGNGSFEGVPAGVEAFFWLSLNDLYGALGGDIRTNLDAFDLTEAEKSLVVALSCGGRDVGQIVAQSAETDVTTVLHRIGLELVQVEEPSATNPRNL